MKDGALLVNVARGRRGGHQGAAGRAGQPGGCAPPSTSPIPEPLPPGHPLWHAPGVLISPHVGGPTSAFLPRAKRLLRAQLNRFAAGEPLEQRSPYRTERQASRASPDRHARKRATARRARNSRSSRSVEELCP